MREPERYELDLATVLHALGDPVRLALVRRMADGGESVCSPVGIDVPRSTLTNHWRILREAGITRTRRIGKARMMTLRRDTLDARFPGLLTAVLADDRSTSASAGSGGAH